MREDTCMLKSEDVLEMEKEMLASFSSEFFNGTHTQMDLIIYEAYCAVQHLRMMLEEYELGLRELAEELKEEVCPKGIVS